MKSLRTSLLLLGAALLLALPGHAQGGGHGGGGRLGGGRAPGEGPDSARSRGGVGSQPGMGGLGNIGGRGGIPPAANGARGGGGMTAGAGGSLPMGPVGRWWDDKHYAGALGLRADQKRRMDAIFNGNRGELTEKVETLRQEESRLEFATRDTRLSQESIFGQMDRVAQARDALEKVNQRLLESLKKELDDEQASKIQTLK